MSDVTCPYCEHEQEINHDDGYGYEEDIEHEQECQKCEKTFKFHTSISFCYDVHCDGEHDLEQSPVKDYGHIWSCNRCCFYEVRR